MKKHLNSTKHEWETLARLDALWAILGGENKRFGRWNQNEFFATGEIEIASVISHLKEKGISLENINSVLDFGCGVGRLTRALSKHFPKVYGIDISNTMIKKAKKLNAKYKNCSFLVNKGHCSLNFPDNHFDFIYSYIVLQHFPNKETIFEQILDFIRILKPSGIAFFQLPSSLPFLSRLHLRRRLYHFLRSLGLKENFLYRKLHLYGFSMLSVPIEKVKSLMENNKVEIIDIKDEGSINTSYLVRKPRGFIKNTR